MADLLTWLGSSASYLILSATLTRLSLSTSSTRLPLFRSSSLHSAGSNPRLATERACGELRWANILFCQGTGLLPRSRGLHEVGHHAWNKTQRRKLDESTEGFTAPNAKNIRSGYIVEHGIAAVSFTSFIRRNGHEARPHLAV